MKVLGHLHRYCGPNGHNAGAEVMAHAIFRWLAGRGHEVRALSLAGTQGDQDGIPVTIAKRDPDLYAWADVVVTHLDVTQVAMREARVAGKPIVHLLHNDNQLRFHRVRPADAQLIVFNSHWIERAVKWRGPTIVVRPPCSVADYRVERGRRATALTLINMTAAKGSGVFYELAGKLPRHRFIGVLGAYGLQDVPKGMPRNVELREHTHDIRKVYEQTRLLLMPSSYESWGRVALEAAASGIPTIAHPTPGLVESLGPAGTFVDRDLIEDWVAAVERFDDDQRYDLASADAVARALYHDHDRDLIGLEKALATVIEKGRERQVRYAR